MEPSPTPSSQRGGIPSVGGIITDLQRLEYTMLLEIYRKLPPAEKRRVWQTILKCPSADAPPALLDAIWLEDTPPPPGHFPTF